MMDGKKPMCEMIISVSDKTSPDPHIDTKLSKRGVVIDCFEDGHSYGIMELSHPMFRILQMPGQPLSYAQDFMGCELPSSPDANVNHLFARQFKIDIDSASLPEDVRMFIADDSRASPTMIIDPTLISSLKTKRDNPYQSIGSPLNTIG
jgi:hypothetical protein